MSDRRIMESVEICALRHEGAEVLLSISTQAHMYEDPQPHFTTGPIVYRAVQAINEVPQPALWQPGTYQHARAADLLVNGPKEVRFRCVDCHRFTQCLTRLDCGHYRGANCHSACHENAEETLLCEWADRKGYRLTVAGTATTVPPDLIPAEVLQPFLPDCTVNDPNHTYWNDSLDELLTFIWEMTGLSPGSPGWELIAPALCPLGDVWGRDWHAWQRAFPLAKEEIRQAASQGVFQAQRGLITGWHDGQMRPPSGRV